MADTTSTGNTTPTVDQATPTDTTTAQSTGETVQLAVAAATVQVSAPAPGAEVSLTVEPGQTVQLGDPVIRFTQDGADLVIHWTNGAHTTVVDALAAGTPLILADGTTLTFEQILALIPDLDPGAFAPAAVEPAAGPLGERAAGGAYNTPFDNGTLGPPADTTALLLNTELQFGLLEFFVELPGEVGDAEVVGVVPEVVVAADECTELRAEFDAAVLAYSAAFPDVKGQGADASDIAIDLSFGTNDLMVGDLFEESNSDISESIDVSNSLSGFDDTTTADVPVIEATNDLLDASSEPGDVTLVGDVFLNQIDDQSNVELVVDFSNSVSGGDRNLFNAFADDLRGGDGDDILVGDAFLNGPNSNSMFVTVDLSNGVTDGDDNTFNAFNDILDGDGGNDLLVGDVNLRVGSSEFELTLDVSNTVVSGDGNQFNVFDDGLIGGDGDDELVGDMRLFIADTSVMEVTVDISNFVEGGSDNSFFAFNDMLDGGAGNDFLVGDISMIRGGTSGSPNELTIDVRNTIEAESFAEGSADNNSFTAFSDMLEGGDDSDVLVGDLYYDQNNFGNDLEIDVSNSVSGHIDGEGGTADNNSFSVFDDILDGGPGRDLLVGDIFVDKKTTSGTDHTINLSNSVTDGDNNSFSAFNDFLFAGTGGVGAAAGGFGAAPSVIDEAEDNAGLAADNNTFATAQDIPRSSFGVGPSGDVFDDSFPRVTINGEISFSEDVDFYRVELFAGETVIFDIDNEGVPSPVDTQLFLFDADGILLAENDDASTGLGGGGSTSTFDSFLTFTALSDGFFFIAVDAFDKDPIANIGDPFAGFDSDGSDDGDYVLNISIEPGPPGDVLVGDYLIRTESPFDTSNDITIDVSNSIEGGVDNTFNAFEDILIGGVGDDLLVGDMMLEAQFGEGGSADIFIDVAGNGDINLFNDHLCGDAGDDTLYGDFFADDGGSFDLTFNGLDYLDFLDSLSGEDFTLTMFEDTLDGASGDDDLIGGFGDDTLIGGTGDDTFLYESIADGNDVITDFFDGADTIDLDDLFDALNTDGSHDGDYDEGGTERTDALIFSEDGAGDLVLTVDDTNNGEFADFSITFLGLDLTDEAAVGAAIVTE